MAAFSLTFRQVKPDIFLWEMKGQPTLEEWVGATEKATQWMRSLEMSHRKCGVVIDAGGVEKVTAQMRSIAGEWRGSQKALISRTIDRGAYVAPNALLRGIITAVFWIAKPVIPVIIKSSIPEAIVWIETEREKKRTT